MSINTGVVTSRDVLGWAIQQGVFTEDRDREQRPYVSPTGGVEGPWTAVLNALVNTLGERLFATEYWHDNKDQPDLVYDVIVREDLPRICADLKLTTEQAQIASGLVTELRLFFDGVLSIHEQGLDAPVKGDLGYQCRFDYTIDIPGWAAHRAQ